MAIDDAVAGRGWFLDPAREADWDALYAEQLPRVYNYFRFRVGEGAVAEDLTSVTFEKAWRARHRYRRDLAGFSTWLLVIARNVAIDHFRSRRVHAPLEVAERLPGGSDPGDQAERRSEFERLAPPARAALRARARDHRAQIRRRLDEPGDRARRSPQRIERRHASCTDPCRHCAPTGRKEQRDGRAIPGIAAPRAAPRVRPLRCAAPSPASRTRMPRGRAGDRARGSLPPRASRWSSGSSRSPRCAPRRRRCSISSACASSRSCQVDAARLQQLRDRNFDPASLIGGDRVVLQDPGPSREFASLEAAAAAAGLSPERPALLPRGLKLDTVFVNGESRSRVTVNTKPLSELMAVFDVRDLTLPAGLDGGTVEVHLPPVIVERYRSTGRVARGVHPVRRPRGGAARRAWTWPGSGEIGLRILGMPAADANRLAGAHRLALHPDRARGEQRHVVPAGRRERRARRLRRDDPVRGPGRRRARARVGRDVEPRQGRVYAVMGNLDRLSTHADGGVRALSAGTTSCRDERSRRSRPAVCASASAPSARSRTSPCPCAQGEVFGFLGPNGAGKTTSIKMLLGLIEPTGGTARVLGAPLGDRGDAGPHRIPAGALPVPGLAHRPRAARAPRPAVRHAGAEIAARAADGCSRASTWCDAAAPPPARVQQGHAAAHRARGGAAGAPRGGVPRRTDVRARSAGPAHGAGRHPRTARRRRDRVPQLAPARRGRGHLRPRRVRAPGPRRARAPARGRGRGSRGTRCARSRSTRRRSRASSDWRATCAGTATPCGCGSRARTSCPRSRAGSSLAAAGLHHLSATRDTLEELFVRVMDGERAG